MPAVASVVLTDRATTPVNHTLVPVGKDANGVWTFEKSNGQAIGSTTLSVSSRRQGDKYRARFVLKTPVVQDETINGITKPTIIRTGFAEVSFTFALGSTPQERKDTIGMIASTLAVNAAVLHSALNDMQAVY